VSEQPFDVAAYAAAQAKNYSEYVAASDIYIGGAFAYAANSPVSSASVEDGTLRPDQVVKVGSKAAADIPAAAPVAPVDPSTIPTA
jgi:hypothetical protein